MTFTKCVESRFDEKMLRCAICSGYLSRPPIRNNADGTIYHCGRCITNDPTVNIRNYAYEHLAQYMTFPCIHPNCNVNVKWGNVEQHELVCLNKIKIMICPVPHCAESIQVTKVVNHFDECHQDKVVDHSFNMNWHLDDPYFLFVGLLMHNEIPYILIICNCEMNLRVSVHSICNSTNKKYRLTLWSKPLLKEILIGSQEITKFNNRKHCVKYYIGTCPSREHDCPKASSSDDISKRMTTVISMDAIKSFFPSELVGFTVSIESFGKEEFNAGISIRKKMKCPSCKGIVYNCACSRIVWNNAKLMASMRRQSRKFLWGKVLRPTCASSPPSVKVLRMLTPSRE